MATRQPPSVIPLRKPDVLASWPLRPLSSVERDSLPFAELVKGDLTAGRAVEEVLISIGRQDEPESFITHQTFNGAVHCCHLCFLESELPAYLGPISHALSAIAQHRSSGGRSIMPCRV